MNFLSNLAFRIIATWGGVATGISSLPGSPTYSGNKLQWITWTEAERAYSYITQPKYAMMSVDSKTSDNWEEIHNKVLESGEKYWAGPHDLERLRYKNNLAIACFFLERYDEASRYIQESVHAADDNETNKLYIQIAKSNKEQIDKFAATRPIQIPRIKLVG